MRKYARIVTSTMLLLLITTVVYSIDWTVDVTVAQDGSGDYTTITEAIDNKPADGSNYVIFIKEGIYDEKLFIQENNITLLGENREGTIITQAILRRIFRETNDSDWGVATINIQDNVSNLTLANLTVRNNFADLNPDVSNNNDHTMAIRGGGDKIIIVNCNVIATGGDTLSLWNTNGGRYYHSGCYFEGYVDYVCPRGYCYISNSDFYGYNKNASIWHDGSGAKDHKLVVKNSNFDGVSNFGLGRFHRMSAFYLLECNFTNNLSDNEINYVGDSTEQDRDKLLYGVRTYFDKTTRETGDYDWHRNNLSSAEGSPAIEEITDAWTFNDTWNPEMEIRGLLRCAFLPKPGYYAKKVDIKPVLSWTPGQGAVKHLLYLGENEDPEFIAKLSDTSYTVQSELNGASRYFWRVDEVLNSGDTIKGAIWIFTTNVSATPTQVSNPYPPVDTNFFRYSVLFDWVAQRAEVDTFYFYFGSESNLDLLSKQTGVGYQIEGLIGDSIYFWRVDAKNDLGLTPGPLWYFNYKPETPSGVVSQISSNNMFTIYPNPVIDKLTVESGLLEKGPVDIHIYDMSGKLSYYESVDAEIASSFKHTISVNEFSTINKHGYFVLQILNGNKSESVSFIVQ